MTTDKAVKTVAEYIAEQISASDTLADLWVVQNGDDDNLPTPRITVDDTGSEEHEAVPNVLTVSLSVALVTTPGESDQSATTFAQHRAMSSELGSIVSRYYAIEQSANTEPYFLCFDVRGMAPNTISEDGLRVTRFPLVMVCQSTS